MIEEYVKRSREIQQTKFGFIEAKTDCKYYKEDFQKQPARAWPLQTTETELFSHFIFISFDENIYQRSTDYSQQI